MDLKSFSISSMVAISSPWTDEKADRPLLASIPLISALLTALSEVHQSLVTLRVTISSSSKELKALIGESLLLDRLHDSLYRGCYNILSGASDIAEDETKKADILEVRDTLFPKGPGAVLESYLDEVGNIEIMAARLTPEIKSFLKAIVIDNVTLSTTIDKLVETGAALGKAERRKARTSDTANNGIVRKSDVLKARYRWINIVQTMIQLLDIAPEVTEETKNLILQPLLREEAKRAGKRAADDVSDETETDEPTEEEVVSASNEPSSTKTSQSPA
jgi:hypothetical protein